MEPFWYKDAVIYGIDVSTFADSNGDGIGDFPGLTSRLDHLTSLGVTCLWLLPFCPSPGRDNGYDIQDYYGIDPQFGSLEDFIEFVHRAGERGIRVILDLVMNHTSNEHPWFQAARRDPHSGFRNYYVWADSPPPIEPGQGTIFGGQEKSVWTYDEVAGAYYYHRFYSFQPGLRLEREEVRAEIKRVLDFWLSFPVAGFRVDAASHMIEKKGIPESKPADPHGILKELRAFVDSRRHAAVLVGEADVEAERLDEYFGDGDELNLIFNFLLDNYLFLSFASKQGEPVMRALKMLPSIPEAGQWANFLRNLDELDLERLSEQERNQVLEQFAPDEGMRIFGRGIRRRLAPMLGDDLDRRKMAFSLLFSLPGTPVFVYGDEIGMGEDLSLQGRNAVRTPMQWSAAKNAGFSEAPTDQLVRPVVTDGPFAYEQVNVEAQQQDPGSFLNWMKQLIQARRACPEIGWGTCHAIRTDAASVCAFRMEYRDREVILVHNLGDEPVDVEFDIAYAKEKKPQVVFGNAQAEQVGEAAYRIGLQRYGYGWFRLA